MIFHTLHRYNYTRLRFSSSFLPYLVFVQSGVYAGEEMGRDLRVR